jgi:hypothetical protein
MQFAEALPELESLSLLFPDGWIGDVNKYWQSGSYAFSPFHQQIVAREVSLEGCMPESFGSALSYVFDLSRVTKLALLNCKSELLRILSSSSELRNMVYFEIRTVDSFDEDVSEGLKALFVKNPSLQHICLHIYDLSLSLQHPQANNHTVSSDHSYNCMPYLLLLRSTLRTFSLWDLRFAESWEFSHLDEPGMKHICSQFSALEQLGVSLRNERIYAHKIERRDHETLRWLVSSD